MFQCWRLDGSCPNLLGGSLVATFDQPAAGSQKATGGQ